MSDLQSKTDEELNRMLAELAGWTFHDVKTLPHTGEMVYEKFWLRPGVKIEELNADDICWREGASVPRFCSSLDEVARVEAGLMFAQYQLFQGALAQVWTEDRLKGQPDCPRAPLSATARQRTIALIETLQKP